MLSIPDNSIVICSEQYKLYVLKNINKLCNIKFKTKQQFLKEYCFDYDENTILYLMKKYSLKYDIAKEYINCLYYIEDKSYENEKLKFLANLKQELITNNLIKISKNKEYFHNKTIVINRRDYGKFEQHLFKDFHNVYIIEEESKYYIPKVYELDDIEDEVGFVAIKISELLNSGVSIENIKLANVSSDYIDVINKIFGFYNLKVNLFHDIPIFSTVIGKIFYDNLNKGIDCALDSINEYNKNEIHHQIINICNKYAFYDDYLFLIRNALKTNYIKQNKYSNAIECIDIEEYDFNSEYVFLLGFNQGIIPKVYKDEDYINDFIKPEYLDNTIEKNKQSKNNIKTAIYNTPNLTITYKLKSPFQVFYPSNLIEEMNLEVIHTKIDYTKTYSEIASKLKLGILIDDFIKFGKKDESLILLNSNYDIPYQSYSHQFTGVSLNKINDFINKQDKFLLSYSTLDDYNRCSFKFYLEKILKLTPTINSFSVTLGNICHFVLSKAFVMDISVRDEVYNYISKENIELTKSNKFFLEQTISNLEYIISSIKNNQKYCSLNKIKTEEKIEIPICDNIYFLGFIDKIIYDNFDDDIIGAIIDYKTYSKKPSLKYLDYGIDLQLPVYMYLTKFNYPNIKFAGFYLQNISLEHDIEKSNLKLLGFTNKDKNIILKLDSEYEDSNLIDGMKINKDGSFSASTEKRLLTYEQMDLLIEKVNQHILNMIENLKKSKFDINPKYDKGNIGCDFCKFRDICFMKEYDFVNITTKDGDLDE